MNISQSNLGDVILIKSFSGTERIIEAFENNWMTELLGRIKNQPKTEKNIEQILVKNSNQSYKKQSQIGQNALIGRNFLWKNNNKIA